MRTRVGPNGLPVPEAPPIVLRDSTALLSRRRHGNYHATVQSTDGHIIGRAYGHDKLMMNMGGPWRPVQTRPGAVTITPANVKVTWDIPVANDFSLVIVPVERLAACAAELGQPRFELAQRVASTDESASALLDLLERETRTIDRSSSLLFDRAINLLCLHLVRGTAPAAPRRGLAPWQVKRVIQFMQDHLSREIGSSELAQVVGLSRFHFCTVFRLATGQTPHRCLTALRVERAKQLLED
ncbi:MAG: AraC family transcriptional regulator [Kofleriaceae bacterium]